MTVGYGLQRTSGEIVKVNFRMKWVSFYYAPASQPVMVILMPELRILLL